VQFNATATLSDGKTQNVTLLVTWSVSDVLGSGVATISTKGLATTRTAGLAQVKATFSSLSATADLYVLGSL
jgi:hypothetical protein